MTETTGDLPGRPSTDEVLRDLTNAPDVHDHEVGTDTAIEVVQTDTGVFYVGSDPHCHRHTFAIPNELLQDLQEAWAEEDDAEPLIQAVARIFGPGKGLRLAFLDECGVTRP